MVDLMSVIEENEENNEGNVISLTSLLVEQYSYINLEQFDITTLWIGKESICSCDDVNCSYLILQSEKRILL